MIACSLIKCVYLWFNYRETKSLVSFIHCAATPVAINQQAATKRPVLMLFQTMTNDRGISMSNSKAYPDLANAPNQYAVPSTSANSNRILILVVDVKTVNMPVNFKLNKSDNSIIQQTNKWSLLFKPLFPYFVIWWCWRPSFSFLGCV